MDGRFGRGVNAVVLSGAMMGLVLAVARPALAQLGSAANSTGGATCSGGGSTDGDCRNSVAFSVPNSGTTFTSRYAWNINADTGVGSTHDTSSNAQHNLTFTATAVGGYSLAITGSRVGDMNRISDVVGCDGSADTGAISGTSNIALSSGGLGIADPGSVGNGGGDSNSSFSQSGGSGSSATICRNSNSVAQSHSLSFTWSGSVRSNSCEAAVRQGESSGTTTGCSACGYGGSPGRTQSTDGHFVTVTYTSLCGNGVVDACAGEVCDPGAANSACCNTNCTFKASTVTCRASAGVCDVAENCTGSSAACPADAFLPSTTVCRAAPGVCDNAENCTGSAAACPADAFKASTTVCRPTAGVCDVAENCTGSGASCPADAFLPSTTVCRAAPGVCDNPENCTGSSAACPADAFKPSTTVCRPTAGVCDAAENCTGSGATCPADGFLASTTVCRSAAGECDLTENCPGSGAACPADAKKSSGTACTADANPCSLDQCDGSNVTCQHPAGNPGAVCRPVAGVCDVQETCTGSSTTCPADAFLASTTVCRPSAGECDVAENCTGSSATCPANGFQSSSTPCTDDGNGCTDDHCNGAGTCIHPDNTAPCTDGLFCNGTDTCSGGGCNTHAGDPCTGGADCNNQCNEAADDCLNPAASACSDEGNPCTLDQCDGSGTCTHPAGNAGAICRAAAGVCDVTELCDGSSTTCPADAKGSGVCRPTAGVCDLPESCDGVGNDCPPDSVAGAFVVCRPSAGECDLTENCDGVGAACPADDKKLSGTVCTGDGNGCTEDECDGVGDTCTHPPNSAPCSDGLFCNGPDTCGGGTCSVHAGDPCVGGAECADACNEAADNCFVTAGTGCTDDGNGCTDDQCSGAGACVHPNNTAPCTDGLFCTGTDTCSGGGCNTHTGDPCAGGPVCSNGCNETADDCLNLAGSGCTSDGNPCTADQCDGSGSCTHPAGNAGAVCRAAAGVCDVAELCDGTSTSCPADSVAGAFVVCRAAAGECDLAENCDGAGIDCPADAKQVSGTPCTDDGNVCTLDQCNGTSAVCQHPAGNAGAVCRSAVGECDFAETCTGASPTCPADTTQPDGTVCTSDGDQCTADTCQAGVCTHTQNIALCLDHYQCDKIKKTAGTPKFVKIVNLPLVDDYEGGLFDVKSYRHLCLPADKNSGGNLDAVTHLQAYIIKPSIGQPLHVPQTNILVTNQLGSIRLNTKKASRLLVPTAKNLVSSPPAPIPSSHNVDHFKCYKVKVTPQTPKFPRGLQVTVGDQFTSPPKTYDVKALKELCNVVDKNSEGVKDASRHMVCYKVKPAIGQPLHTPRLGVFLNNQFGPSKIDTIKEDLFCIPSTRTP